MSAKEKRNKRNSPLRIVIILILLGLLAYKYQLFDGKLLENIPAIENNERKARNTYSDSTWRCIGNPDDAIGHRRTDIET